MTCLYAVLPMRGYSPAAQSDRTSAAYSYVKHQTQSGTSCICSNLFPLDFTSQFAPSA